MSIRPTTAPSNVRDVNAYPQWIRDLVAVTEPLAQRVAQHPGVLAMRDAQLPPRGFRAMVCGLWPTIEQFPQFMSLNLAKTRVGRSPGEDRARQFLLANMRVEQKHAQYWIDWAASSGITVADLADGEGFESMHALAHWCWYIGAQGTLAEGIIATNYAVEGATGLLSETICSRPTYEQSLPQANRMASMRWLKLHARYDDEHPWEALACVAELLGPNPSAQQVQGLHRAARMSLMLLLQVLDTIVQFGKVADNDPAAPVSAGWITPQLALA